MPKISALTANTALDGTELVAIVQNSTTKRCTTQDIADLGGGGGSTPTGTGFVHVTGGSQDAAAAKVDLTDSADVTTPAAGPVIVSGGALTAGTIDTTNSSHVTVPSSGVVRSNGSVLSSGNVNVSTEVEGTLTVPYGGTGAASFTASGVLCGNGTGAIYDATNVTAGTDYLAVGANATASQGLLEFGEMLSGTLIGVKSKWSGSYVDIPWISVGSGFDFTVGNTSNVYHRVRGQIVEVAAGAGGLYLYSGASTNLYLTSTQNRSGLPIIGNTGTSSPYGAHGYVQVNFSSDANVTLNSAQYIYEYVELSDTGLALTTGHFALFPDVSSDAAAYTKTVWNNTAYNQTIALSYGSSVTLTAGSCQRYCFNNSVGVVNASAAFTP